MKILNTLILATALTISPFAFAASDSSDGESCKLHHKQGLFEGADKNNDGSIDKNEARAMHDKHFDEADTNHDGKLSADEVKNCQSSHGAKHEKGSMGFKNADKNSDGKLDRAEAASMPKVIKNFDAIDANKDGLLERDEVHTHMKNRLQ